MSGEDTSDREGGGLAAALRARAGGASLRARRSWSLGALPSSGMAWDRFTTENAGLFGTVGPALVGRLANVSLLHRYLYFETPGAGSTAVKLALRRLETGDDALILDDPLEVHARQHSPLLSPLQVGSFRRLLASEGAEGVLRFAFVRNPFARVLAAFLSDAWDESSPPLRNRFGRPASAVHFDEFLDAVAATPVALMSPWWMVQHHLLLAGRLRFDVLGRFERLDDDLVAIGRRIAPDFERCVRREEIRAEVGRARLGDYYDARLVEIVRRTYAEDFDAFGYARDLSPDEVV